jgi:hypothetical protein
MWWLFQRRFETERTELYRAELVAAHEAGHAILGYYHGEAVGLISIVPLGLQRFAGRHRHGPPIAATDEVEHFPRAVERLLAGDLAARIVGRLSLRRISIPVPNPRVDPYVKPSDVLDAILRADESNKTHDLAKVFAAIKQYGRQDQDPRGRHAWWPWLWKRCRVSRNVLSSRSGRAALQSVRGLLLDNIGKVVPGDVIYQTLDAAGAPIRDAMCRPTILP